MVKQSIPLTADAGNRAPDASIHYAGTEFADKLCALDDLSIASASAPSSVAGSRGTTPSVSRGTTPIVPRGITPARSRDTTPFGSRNRTRGLTRTPSPPPHGNQNQPAAPAAAPAGGGGGIRSFFGFGQAAPAPPPPPPPPPHGNQNQPAAPAADEGLNDADRARAQAAQEQAMQQMQDQGAAAMQQLVGAEDDDELVSPAEADNICPICHEELDATNSFTTTCNHTYHLTCIHTWSGRNNGRVANIRFTCPGCRHPQLKETVNNSMARFLARAEGNNGASPAAGANVDQPGMARRAMNMVGRAAAVALGRANQGDAEPAAQNGPPSAAELQAEIALRARNREAAAGARAPAAAGARAPAAAGAEAPAAAGAEASAAAGAEASAAAGAEAPGPAVPPMSGLQQGLQRHRRAAAENDNVHDEWPSSDEEAAAPGQQPAAPVEQAGAPVEQTPEPVEQTPEPVEQALQPIIGIGQCRLCGNHVREENTYHGRNCPWHNSNRPGGRSAESWH